MRWYHFGIMRKKLSQAEVTRRDKICQNESGDKRSGYFQRNCPPEGWVGWFAIPNHGFPFDKEVEKRVMARL